MKCFAFVIHHLCSYRAGMLIISAEDFDHAVKIAKDAKQKDVLRRYEESYGSYDEYPLMEEDDEILEHYPETISAGQKYKNIWCLYHIFELAGAEKPGIRALAYHDG